MQVKDRIVEKLQAAVSHNSSSKNTSTLCNPLDLNQFHQRVATFTPSVWFDKPYHLNPLQCARYGFQATSTANVLECQDCREIIVFFCEPKCENVSANLSLWEVQKMKEKIYQIYCDKFLDRIKIEHRKDCVFLKQPSPLEFTQFKSYESIYKYAFFASNPSPSIDDMNSDQNMQFQKLLWNRKHLYDKFYCIKLSKIIKHVPEDMISQIQTGKLSEQICSFLPTFQFIFETMQNYSERLQIKTLSLPLVILGILGWTFQTNLFLCKYCQMKWEKQSLKGERNVWNLHRWWCPMVYESSSELTVHSAGWKQMLTHVKDYCETLLEEERESKTESKLETKIEDFEFKAWKSIHLMLQEGLSKHFLKEKYEQKRRLQIREQLIKEMELQDKQQQEEVVNSNTIVVTSTETEQNATAPIQHSPEKIEEKTDKELDFSFTDDFTKELETKPTSTLPQVEEPLEEEEEDIEEEEMSEQDLATEQQEGVKDSSGKEEVVEEQSKPKRRIINKPSSRVKSISTNPTPSTPTASSPKGIQKKSKKSPLQKGGNPKANRRNFQKSFKSKKH